MCCMYLLSIIWWCHSDACPPRTLDSKISNQTVATGLLRISKGRRGWETGQLVCVAFYNIIYRKVTTLLRRDWMLRELCLCISVFLVTEAGWGSPIFNQECGWTGLWHQFWPVDHVPCTRSSERPLHATATSRHMAKEANAKHWRRSWGLVDSFHELRGSMSVPAFNTWLLSAHGLRNGYALAGANVIICHHLRLIWTSGHLYHDTQFR